VPVLCGTNPPTEPENTRTRQGKRDAWAYARYFVSNYVPWSVAEPPSLDYASWKEVKRGWVADADPSPPHSALPPQGDSTELIAGHFDREERRKRAVTRLFMVENASNGFRVDTKAVILNGKFRMRGRTLWRTDEDGNDNRPGGGGTVMRPATRIGKGRAISRSFGSRTVACTASATPTIPHNRPARRVWGRRCCSISSRLDFGPPPRQDAAWSF
jgi:hypothetical protein